MATKLKSIKIVVGYEEDGKSKSFTVEGKLLDLHLSQSVVGFKKNGTVLPAHQRKMSIMLHAMTKAEKFERDNKTEIKLQRARK